MVHIILSMNLLKNDLIIHSVIAFANIQYYSDLSSTSTSYSYMRYAIGIGILINKNS